MSLYAQAVAAERAAKIERDMLEHQENIAAIRRERDELLADAMRYRAIKQWHKAYVLGGIPGGVNVHILTSTRWPEQLDAAIDSAIASGKDAS